MTWRAIYLAMYTVAVLILGMELGWRRAYRTLAPTSPQCADEEGR